MTDRDPGFFFGRDQHPVYHPNIFWSADFAYRDADDLERNNGRYIVFGKSARQRIHPGNDAFSCRGQPGDVFRNDGPRFDLFGGGHGVFEIGDQPFDLEPGGFFQHRKPVAGYEQQGPGILGGIHCFFDRTHYFVD